MRELHISPKEEGQRLDKFLMKYISLAPKSFVYKMLRKKNIKLNDKKAEGNEILKDGDSIKLFLAEETIEKFSENISVAKTSMDFDVVFEDSNIILCNKPQGLIVHPDKEHKSNTLNDQLIYYLTQKGEYNPTLSMGFVPSVCNRLDLNTSGIVTMGKNLPSVQELNRGFKERLIDKYYITLVKGEVKSEGVVEGWHTKSDNNIVNISSRDNGGSYVCTKYKPIDCKSGYTLLEVKLETGKSHQIRACMQYIGHTIVGDRKYGDKAVNAIFRNKFALDNQFLHSYKIVFKFNDGQLSYLKGKEFLCPPKGVLNNIIETMFK